MRRHTRPHRTTAHTRLARQSGRHTRTHTTQPQATQLTAQGTADTGHGARRASRGPCEYFGFTSRHLHAPSSVIYASDSTSLRFTHAPPTSVVFSPAHFPNAVLEFCAVLRDGTSSAAQPISARRPPHRHHATHAASCFPHCALISSDFAPAHHRHRETGSSCCTDGNLRFFRQGPSLIVETRSAGLLLVLLSHEHIIIITHAGCKLRHRCGRLKKLERLVPGLVKSYFWKSTLRHCVPRGAPSVSTLPRLEKTCRTRRDGIVPGRTALPMGTTDGNLSGYMRASFSATFVTLSRSRMMPDPGLSTVLPCVNVK